MANVHRGEVPFDLDGRRVMLRLTLGSLANLEDAFGAAGLAGLGQRLSAGRLSARDVAEILAAGLHGADGHCSAEALSRRIPASALEAAAGAAVALLAAAFGGADEQRPPATGSAP